MLNGEARIQSRVRALREPIFLSAIVQVELESGIHVYDRSAETFRKRLDTILLAFPVYAFTEECARTYGQIVAVTGFSRRKVTDRMIAATALVHGLTLVTLNAGDFSDVPGLVVEAW
jgi:tRNA(fMet)-specific endonuclease VapC